MVGEVRSVNAVLVHNEPTSAGLVRRQLSQELTEQGVSPESIDEVVLVASELVGNAVRHAAAPGDRQIEVTWSVDDDGVVVSIADSSAQQPQPRSAEPDEAGGRGLTIIQALAAAWGVEPTTTGKRVWARVPIGREPAAS